MVATFYDATLGIVVKAVVDEVKSTAIIYDTSLEYGVKRRIQAGNVEEKEWATHRLCHEKIEQEFYLEEHGAGDPELYKIRGVQSQFNDRCTGGTHS